MNHPLFRAAALALVALTLAACATAPQVRSHADASADFDAYRTYGFVATPGTDERTYTSLLTRHLKDAVSEELDARGYRQVDEDPDLTVNFYLRSDERRQVRERRPSGAFGYHSGWYGMWGPYPGLYGFWGPYPRWYGVWDGYPGWTPRHSPRHGFRAGYGPGYGFGFGADFEREVTYITEHALHIDLVDTARNQLVWEGIAEGRLVRGIERNPEGTVREAVPQIFTEYPHRADAAD